MRKCHFNIKTYLKMENQNNVVWTAFEKFIFRACLIFFTTFALSNGIIPYISEAWTAFGHQIGHWLKGILLGITTVVEHEMNGSGDTSDDYGAQLFFFLFSIVAAAFWTLIDRKSRSYDTWYYWLRVFIRYSLGLTMMMYGIAKVVPGGQFAAPNLTLMTRPLGNFTPMGLAWAFFGYSYTYSFFGGFMELVGGLALFFRRTTTFGVLLLITVISNIVMINFAYDVSVKLYSSIYLLMAFFLLAKDVKRLWHFLYDVENLEVAPIFDKKIVRFARIAFKSLLLLLAIGFPIYQIFFEDGELSGKKSAIHGIYDVESFEKNNKTMPLVLNDTTLWKRIVISEGYGGNEYSGVINFSIVKRERASYVINDTTKTINVTFRRDSMQNFTAHYHQPDSLHLVLEGVILRDTIKMTMKKFRSPQLETHGFHWISESPHNY